MASLRLSFQKGLKQLGSKLQDQDKKGTPDAYVTPFDVWSQCDWDFIAYNVRKGGARLKIVDRNAGFPNFPSFDVRTARQIIDPFRNLCYVCARYNWRNILTPGWDLDMQLSYLIESMALLEPCSYPNPYRGINLSVDYQLVNPQCALCGFLMRARQHMGLRAECLASSDNQVLQYYISKTTQVVTLHMGDLFLKTLDDSAEQLMRAGQGDLRNMKSFLRTCVRDHPDCNKKIRDRALTLYTDPNLRLRVFDIRTNRVIPAPPNCRYIALSYVWGGHISPQLTQAQLIKPPGASTLSNAYALIDPKFLLPTIADAIAFVRMMGERYIWVDQLCIVQDDPTEMSNTVAAMNRIYNASVFTIIAADGDATFGLPGVRKNSRNLDPIITSIDGVTLVVAEPEIKSLATSRWASRGWTYQEMELSTRHFIFTKGRIYYQCREMVRLESDPNRIFERPTPSDTGSPHAGPPGFAEYAFHVERYSPRSLTYSSDVLRAFQGIQSDLSDRFDMKFCHGIPIDDSPNVLLWSRPGDSKPLQRRSNFPSWSWAGWTGPVCYEMPYNCSNRVIPTDSDWESALDNGVLNIEGICFVLALKAGGTRQVYHLDAEDWVSGSRLGILMTTENNLPPGRNPTWEFLIVRPEGSESWCREGFISIMMDRKDMGHVERHDMRLKDVSAISSADGAIRCQEAARGIFQLV
ncbi:hypothetical protein FE257_004490 [Aspergillus nanangensis]|uniref:Heterokaryon incompatibility domain-containing protein n=1 Tax=Aspergillus nanangensis TaxID=2582783 RepID=A0AAD4GYF8_ASPNN|nr:hypothetical protein FE257_004490 [Aspergillus nanangensis]